MNPYIPETDFFDVAMTKGVVMQVCVRKERVLVRTPVKDDEGVKRCVTFDRIWQHLSNGRCHWTASKFIECATIAAKIGIAQVGVTK